MRPTSFLRQSAVALRVLLVLTVVLGAGYPLTVTAFAQLAAPGGANGSRVEHGGHVIGSRLIAQPFEGPQWFHPRPSAAGDGYDTLASSASNLSAEHPDLVTAVRERRTAYARAHGIAERDVPADAVTAGGSGLDPHISVANARHQATRVARARGIAVAEVMRLVDDVRQGRILGILGEERVNVLELNLDLAQR